jgi:hypothetical protein
MTPEGKFRDSEIHCSKFGDLSDTSCQVQGPPLNFSLYFAIIQVLHITINKEILVRVTGANIF